MEDKAALERSVIFYVLQHPISKEIVYVGKTVHRLEHRLNIHFWNGRADVGNWVRSVFKSSLRPNIIEIGRCLETEDWQSIERMLISEYRYYGYKLYNICNGGLGTSGVKKTPYQNEQISKRNSIVVFSYNISTKEVKKHTSFVKASKELNVSQSLISNAIQRGGSGGGYLFSRDNEFFQNEISKSYRKKVKCINQSGEEVFFRSSNEAGKKLGLYPDFVRKVANGEYSQYKGLRFEYCK